MIVDSVGVKVLDSHSRYRSFVLLPRNLSPYTPAYSLLLEVVSSYFELPSLQQKRHHHFRRFHHLRYFQNALRPQNLRHGSLASSSLWKTNVGKGYQLQPTVTSEQLIVEIAGAKHLDDHYRYHSFPQLVPRQCYSDGKKFLIPRCHQFDQYLEMSLLCQHVQFVDFVRTLHLPPENHAAHHFLHQLRVLQCLWYDLPQWHPRGI